MSTFGFLDWSRSKAVVLLERLLVAELVDDDNVEAREQSDYDGFCLRQWRGIWCKRFFVSQNKHKLVKRLWFSIPRIHGRMFAVILCRPKILQKLFNLCLINIFLNNRKFSNLYIRTSKRVDSNFESLWDKFSLLWSNSALTSCPKVHLYLDVFACNFASGFACVHLVLQLTYPSCAFVRKKHHRCTSENWTMLKLFKPEIQIEQIEWLYLIMAKISLETFVRTYPDSTNFFRWNGFVTLIVTHWKI